MDIPNTKPYWTGKESKYIADALNSNQVSGDGHYTELVANFIQDNFNSGKVFMTTSGTHALEMAAILIGLKPGDEVIMPSFTFPSTACSIMLRGAKPIFAEVLENTLNIDPEDLQRKITAKTRAVIPVHYAGIGCEMDKIMEIAEKNELYVIEDAAQAVNAKYKGKFLGTWGHFGCYSFHGTKNYTSGEGGALLINLNNDKIIQKAEAVWQKGTNRAQFLRGDVDKYNWVDVGSSYTPSDLLMAVLFAQLSDMQNITDKRKSVYSRYQSQLSKYEEQGRLRMLRIPEDCESNYHLFCVIFKNEITRDKVKYELSKRCITATIHYLPLHSSPMGRKLGYCPDELKLTEMVSKCLLRLPLYPGLTEPEVEYVITSFSEVIEALEDV
ncbi:MAG: dTDP-4-amino-4,6-dideoxygalactose transaminase [Clostridiaceae bacterium]